MKNTRTEKRTRTEIKASAYTHKHELVGLMNELYEIGARKDADELRKIILQIEVWQSK